MNIILSRILTILFISLAFTNFTFSQETSTPELRFEINKVNPTISLTKNELTQAISLSDLNPNYQPEWIKEYISVEIQTSHNGNIKKGISKSEKLSQEQKEIMRLADAGKDISVIVKYIPNNSLSQNDIQEISFSFVVAPAKDAQYPGGLKMLKQYLKNNAIDKVTASFKKNNVSSIRFTIDKSGKVANAHVFQSAYQTDNDDKIDLLLLQTISKMPNWTPAQYSNGLKVKQEFVLIVGNMESCLISFIGNMGECK